MSIKVRIPTPLRRFTGGSEEVSVAASSIKALVADLERQYPGIKDRICDEDGKVRSRSQGALPFPDGPEWAP